MPRSRTIYRNGQLFAEYEGDKLTYLNPNYRPPARSDVVALPYVMKDIGEYQSIIDGTMITSRSQHREHMRQHNVIEVGNEFKADYTSPTLPGPGRDIGEAIKRRLDEVRDLPQATYDAQVQEQAAVHQEVASLITAG